MKRRRNRLAKGAGRKRALRNNMDMKDDPLQDASTSERNCIELFRKTTLVIPTLNEEEAIGDVLREVLGLGFPRENILVVDGGSTDRTAEIAKSLGVRVIRQEGRGKTKAVKTALKHVNTSYIALMDGDYTYPAKHLCDLLLKLEEGYDYVIGVRRPAEESQGRLFRIGNRLLTWFFNLLFSTALQDVLSGMYAGRTDYFREVDYETEYFGVESELAAHMITTGKRIAEVPIEYRKRKGKKKLKILTGLSIAKDMIKLTWRYYPAFLIFSLGALILIPSIILGGYVAYMYFFYGIKYHVKGIIAIIGFLVGFQSLLLSLLALFQKRIEIRLARKIGMLERLLKEDSQKNK